MFGIGDSSWRQMFIAKITLTKGIAEVVTGEHSSGPPREDSLPVALAVIPRAKVKFIRVGKEQAAIE